MNIRKITESFPNYSYDLEETNYDRKLYFWYKEQNFFFEIPNDETNTKVKILIEEEWQTFEDEDIEKLIQKTIEIINN